MCILQIHVYRYICLYLCLYICMHANITTKIRAKLIGFLNWTVSKPWCSPCVPCPLTLLDKPLSVSYLKLSPASWKSGIKWTRTCPWEDSPSRKCWRFWAAYYVDEEESSYLVEDFQESVRKQDQFHGAKFAGKVGGWHSGNIVYSSEVNAI